MMGTTSSITVQSLGKVALRVPAVGAKTWCVYVFFSVTLIYRPESSSFEGDIFEQVLFRGLWIDFDIIYSIFSALIALSYALGSSDYCC